MPYEWQDRIVVDPEALEEKAIAQGTRLSVEFILVLLANGWTAGQILARSPLKREGIKAALKYDAEIFKEKAYPLC